VTDLLQRIEHERGERPTGQKDAQWRECVLALSIVS
jgi:hypothetical protein